MTLKILPVAITFLTIMVWALFFALWQNSHVSASIEDKTLKSNKTELLNQKRTSMKKNTF